MALALALLAICCGLVWFVCWIIVVVKMFGQSVLTGILGIICSLYALIWGFQHKEAAGLDTIMMVWAIAILGGIGLQVAMMAMGPAGMLGAGGGTGITP